MEMKTRVSSRFRHIMSSSLFLFLFPFLFSRHQDFILGKMMERLINIRLNADGRHRAVAK